LWRSEGKLEPTRRLPPSEDVVEDPRKRLEHSPEALSFTIFSQ
jgi:hypothetical protein